MKISSDLTNDAVLAELGSRLVQHRLNRNLTQAALAEEAGVSALTVFRAENGESVQAANLIRILRALRMLENLEGLVPEAPISPLQQLRSQGKVRRRASSVPVDNAKADEPWSWGDEEK